MTPPSKMSLLQTILPIARRLIEAWALAGGVLLLAVVLVVAWSMTANILLSAPVPGDFEIVEVGVAVAVFAFLPYCQITGAHVTADIFTAHAPPRVQAYLSILASLVALFCGGLLLWRMALGMGDFRTYEEVTTIYQFPLWMAFVPILVSLALMNVAALISLIEAIGPAGPSHRQAQT